MTKNDAARSRLHVHKTVGRRDSFGVVGQRLHREDTWLVGGQWNHLLFRKNSIGQQTNVYSKVELSFVRRDENSNLGRDFRNNDANAGLTFAIDSETRRFLGAGSGECTKNFDGWSCLATGRVGVAPYVAEFGSLHTWLLLQVEVGRDPVGSRIDITPIVRGFYGPWLLELGVNLRGKILVNGIFRY